MADGMKRTAGVLVRTLQRTQRDPAPFFGTVLADEVDVVAVAAAWRDRRVRAAAAADAEDAARGRGDVTAGTVAAGRAGSGPALTTKERAGAGARDEIADIDPLQQSAAGIAGVDAGPGADQTRGRRHGS